MCAQDRADEDEHGIRIYAGRYSDAYLQRASWQLGYTIVIWRGRHVAEPTELAAQEAGGYWLEVLQVASALQRHFRPVKMNYQTLGNAVPHLHTHLLPRFAQDPAPGRPLPSPGRGAAQAPRGQPSPGCACPALPGLSERWDLVVSACSQSHRRRLASGRRLWCDLSP
jgi:diadenosine tetraphosphate (Ap4A) HIT family hydrolase